MSDVAFREVVPFDQVRSPEWHKRRREGVTASEIAAILGLSSWQSPWSLWHEKAGLIEPEPDNATLRMGRRLESPILDEFLFRHPELDVDRVGLCESVARPWQLATPDALLVEVTADDVSAPIECGEVKTTETWFGWGDEGTGEVPVSYRAQGLWQLDVIGVSSTRIIACRGKQLREYVIVRDEQAEEDLTFMREEALDFLASLAAGKAPEFDGHQATTDGLKQLYADVEDREVTIPKTLAGRWRRAHAGYKAAEQRKKRLDNIIRGRLGNAKYAMEPDGTPLAQRTVFGQRRVDGKRLKAERPDIAKQYVKDVQMDQIRERSSS